MSQTNAQLEADAAAFIETQKAAKAAALKLMKYKRDEVEDSGLKFLLIRAPRVIITADESITGRSYKRK